VAIAVPDLAEAVELFVGLLGGTFVSGGDDERHGLRNVQLALNGLKIELVQPIREDSDLQRFLDRRGPGFHHMTLLVDNLDAAIEDIAATGREVVGTHAEHAAWSETYVRPRSSFGALLQIVETDRDWNAPAAGITLEDVLAGRVLWTDEAFVLRSEIERDSE
jgi:methylmalonyl-CoA/ethylmalonyl-CoA epimerase